nr:hypothetical protein GCM10020093_006860 [Planobispora longispora]
MGSSRGSAPRKIVIRDDALPSLGDLIADIAAAHANRRPVAMHCLTTEALLLALAALDEAGSLDGDRLEHAAVVPAWGIERIHAHGLRVVTQPGFLADRGEEMARDTAPGDLYRYGSLLKAGVMTVPSSDAPYGPADPWQVMAAARDRVIGRRERVSVRVALDGYLTPDTCPDQGRRRYGPARPVIWCSWRILCGTSLRSRTPGGSATRSSVAGSSTDSPTVRSPGRSSVPPTSLGSGRRSG